MDPSKGGHRGSVTAKVLTTFYNVGVGRLRADRCRLIYGGAPEQGVYPGGELQRPERLSYEIISAGFEGINAGIGAGISVYDDQGQVAQPPDFRTELPAFGLTAFLYDYHVIGLST